MIRKFTFGAALLLVLAAGFAAYSVRLGPDINFDLYNYHFYNAWAWLEGRTMLDVLPAGLQTYFNPLLDLPFYLVHRAGGLFWTSAFLGSLFGLLVFCGWLLNRSVFGEVWRPRVPGSVVGATLFALAATALGLSGTATVPSIGTTFNEVQTSTLVILALLAVLAGLRRSSIAGLMLLAGLLIGLAAGLKLTSAVYAPAIVLAALCGLGWKRGLYAAVLISLGWVVGFLAAFGWWGAFMISQYGSPVPPLYNHIFRSEWFPEVSYLDLRFNAKGLADLVTYPWRWAFSRTTLVSELEQRDPRFLIGLAAALINLAIGALRKERSIVVVSVFTLVAYCVWVLQFGILRYAIPIEIACGTSVAISVAMIARWPSVPAVGRALAGLAAAVVACVVVVFTSYSDWGHLPPGTEDFVDEVPQVANGELIILGGGPSAIFAPYLVQPGVQFIGLNFVSSASADRKAGDAIRSALENPERPVRVLWSGRDFDASAAETYGIVVDSNSCQPLVGAAVSATDPVRLCNLLPRGEVRP